MLLLLFFDFLLPFESVFLSLLAATDVPFFELGFAVDAATAEPPVNASAELSNKAESNELFFMMNMPNKMRIKTNKTTRILTDQMAYSMNS